MVFAGDGAALKYPLPCKSQPDLHQPSLPTGAAKLQQQRAENAAVHLYCVRLTSPAASINRCGSSWERTYGGNDAACLAQHRR